MKDILWEFLNDPNNEIINFNVNFFSRLTNECLTIDMSVCNMTIYENLVFVESKNSQSYSVIDLGKVVMIEFVEK